MQSVWNVISVVILIFYIGAVWEISRQKQLLNQALEQSKLSRQIAENAIREIKETQKINDELIQFIKNQVK